MLRFGTITTRLRPHRVCSPTTTRTDWEPTITDRHAGMLEQADPSDPPDAPAPATGEAAESVDVAEAPPTAAMAERGLETLPAGTIARQVWVLALPMLGEQIGSFLVGFVDTWLAGRLSKEATGAVGTGGYMGWFVSMAFMMVGTGAAAVVARCYGAGDRQTANRAMNQSLLLAIGIGLIVTILVLMTAGGLAAILTQTPEARVLFARYVRIDALGYTLFGVMLVCAGAVRAAGDTRTPMLIMIFVNLVNTLVSASLVFGWLALPRLGVTGIAVGTVVARCLGGLLMVGVLSVGLRGLRLRLAALRPDFGVIWRVLRVGLPAGGDAAMRWITQMGFLIIVAHTATGDAAMVNFAAHNIAMRLEAITYLPAVAWMTAAATLVGQYLGAGSPQRAARAGWLAAAQTAVLTSCVAIGFYLLAEPLYRLMSNDPQVWAVGVPAFRILAFMQPFLGVAIVIVGALRGAGDTRITMAISGIGGVLLRLPVAYLGGIVAGGGLLGAWVGMWADNLGIFSMGCWRFLQGGWKRVKV